MAFAPPPPSPPRTSRSPPPPPSSNNYTPSNSNYSRADGGSGYSPPPKTSSKRRKSRGSSSSSSSRATTPPPPTPTQKTQDAGYTDIRGATAIAPPPTPKTRVEEQKSIRQVTAESNRLAEQTKKLAEQGLFEKDTTEKKTDFEIEVERIEGRLGSASETFDVGSKRLEKRKDFTGQLGAFGGGVLSGVTDLAQTTIVVGSGLISDAPKGFPKTQKTIGKITKGAQDFISSGPEAQTAFFSGAIGETSKSFQERPGFMSGRFIGELLFFKGAGKLISGTTTRIGGLKSTLRKPFIPKEKLVVPEVLAGTEKFPLTKGFKAGGDPLADFYKTQTSKIGKDRFVFSATPLIIDKKIVVETGRGLEKAKDVPGLFFSTRGISPYFTRIFGDVPKQYKIIPTSIKEVKDILTPKFPRVLAVKTTPRKIPKSFTGSYKKAQSFFGKEFSNGKAILKETFPEQKRLAPTFTPAATFSGRVEAEAVVGVGKVLEKQQVIGFTKFSRFGPRVPIFEYKVIGTAGKVERQIARLVPGKSISGSQYVPKSYFVGPSSLSAFFVSGFNSLKFKSDGYFSKSSVGSGLSFGPSGFSSASKSSGFVSSGVSSYKPFSSGSGSGRSSVSSSGSFLTSSSVSVPSSKVSSSKPSFSYNFGGGKPVVSVPRMPPRKKSREESFRNKVDKNLYDAYVRKDRNTKWVKVTSKPQPYNAAFNRGLTVADNTIARSVKLKRKGVNNNQFDDPFIRSEKFGRRKSGSKVPGEETIFVEKNKFAIDTIGEKKGLKASKRFSPWVL